MPSPQVSIFINTTFEGLHFWPNAPDSVEYLRYPHRHVFHVNVEIAVKHDERDVEFITFKDEVNKWLYRNLDCRGPNVSVVTYSCESMARLLWEHLAAQRYSVISITVSEDGENGARLYVPPLRTA
jgi:6-pyruvoyl-tetrahydropterin synthase